jgi:hypothetical protein
MKAPSIVGTPCPGTTYLTLSKLIVGARLHLFVDGEEWGQTDIPSYSYTFTVPPLPAGGEIKAYMKLCKKESPAASVKVSDKPNDVSKCFVSDLYECASYIYVKPVPSNCLIYIANKSGQHLSPYHNVISEKLIPINPSLIAGDEITVNVMGCGGMWQEFGPFAVSSGTPPPPTFYEPMQSGWLIVLVYSDHAGARIDVFVNNEWKGKAISVGNLNVTSVSVAHKLKTGDSVFATQTLCGITGRPSKTIKVVKPKPEYPILIEPASGAEGIPVQPLFKWKDPGENQENAAESFHIIVRRNNTEVINTTTLDTQLLSQAVLEYSTEYEWLVDSVNSTGYDSSSQIWSPFTTLAAPPPSEANLRFASQIFSDPPNFPANTVQIFGVTVINDGDTASDPYTVKFFMSMGSANGDIVEEFQINLESLEAGESYTVFTIPLNLEEGTFRLEFFLYVNGIDEVDSTHRVVS